MGNLCTKQNTRDRTNSKSNHHSRDEATSDSDNGDTEEIDPIAELQLKAEKRYKEHISAHNKGIHREVQVRKYAFNESLHQLSVPPKERKHEGEKLDIASLSQTKKRAKIDELKKNSNLSRKKSISNVIGEKKKDPNRKIESLIMNESSDEEYGSIKIQHSLSMRNVDKYDGRIKTKSKLSSNVKTMTDISRERQPHRVSYNRKIGDTKKPLEKKKKKENDKKNDKKNERI